MNKNNKLKDVDNKVDMKKKIFDVIQIENTNNLIDRIFDYSITFIVFLNIIITFLLTFDELNRYRMFLLGIEYFTIVVFTIEYILRIWTAEYLYPQCSKTKAKIKFIFSFFGVVDLLTILPYIIPTIFPTGFIVFRLLRVVRMFHLFRINKQYDSFNVIVEVLNEKKTQITSAILLTLILILSSSLCMYNLEHEAQPEMFKNAFSGIWWSVSAILTVGYGDIYPITLAGKIFAIIISILGVGIVAIPTGIIVSGFYEKSQRIKKMKDTMEKHDLRFISTMIDIDHPWKNKPIKSIELPKDFIISIIERNNEIIIPNGDTNLEVNDKIVLCGQNYQTIKTLEIKEITLYNGHPWIDKFIKDIDISRQTLISSVKRKNKIIIPRGNTLLKENDVLVLCRKNNHIDEYDEYYV